MALYKIYIHGTDDGKGNGGFSIVLVDVHQNNLSHHIGGGSGTSQEMVLKAQTYANKLAAPTAHLHQYKVELPAAKGLDKNADLARALADSAIVYIKSKFLKPDTLKKVKVSDVRYGNPF